MTGASGMEDPYRYPVFFESVSLDKDQRKRIENYFTIRRKSGGGDCGSVTDVDDKVYSISFKEQQDQQRVLQRGEHVLKFPGGTLVLSLRVNPGPSGPSHGTKLDPAAALQQQNRKSTSGSSLQTSGEEYEVQLDPNLLRYLKECPEAEKELEEKLAHMSCSSDLNLHEDKVLVKRSAQPGAGDGSWKSDVDKLFDRYLCHYELDPHKIKALLKSCGPRQTGDQVKLYSETGVAIVVGERCQVDKRLTEIEDSRVKHQRSSSSESQTTARRLGKARLRLLWKDIEHSLRQSFPGLKVTTGDEGQVFLTGSVEEIVKAGELISDKEKLVLERTVSDKSPHFLTFLREVYGGPGVLSGYLGVEDEVEVELRDTELHFFSLCAAKLDDSERKLQQKFKDVKVDVPNCVVVPPKLCEKLQAKSKEMNQKECRAQVALGPNSIVRLVGHAEEVEELNDVLTQFILDQSVIEGTVTLPFQELLQFLPELLKLHKLDFSGVNICPIASSTPMVALEGPSRKVTEVRNRLGPFLDSLVQNKISIDLPGATRYFESVPGRDSLLRVAHSRKCLIHLEEQTLIRRNLGGVKYSLQDGLQVLVCQGDITKQYADALVNAANDRLDHGGGVAAALSKAGGPEVQKESKEIVKQMGKLSTGQVVVTSGGNLKCKALLHAVGPVGGQSGGKERSLLERTIQNALNLAEMMDLKSIAIPCVSSGLFGVPVAVCSEAIVTAVKEFASTGGRSLSRIILIDNRGEVVRAIQEACDRLLQGIGTRDSTSMVPEFQEGTRGAAAAAGGGGGVKVELVQGTIEAQQVDALVSPMVGHDPFSTRIGKDLSNVAGPQLNTKFNRAAEGATIPGDVVVVESLPTLKCKAAIFLNQVCWDSDQNGTAVQVLRLGIRKILAACSIRGFSSVAFPVLGTGAALRFPHRVASRVLMEEVGEFEKKLTSGPPFLIRIVVHPKDNESSKAFQLIQEVLHIRGFTNDVNPDQVSHDEAAAMLGGVRLQMISGDIINAGTDVIVNTTDFANHQTGVSKAILSAAGPTVVAELVRVGIPADYICATAPGLLGCKEIIHATFGRNPQLIRKGCKNVLKLCERKGHVSVAFPAVSTGEAGVSSAEACKAMLDGLTAAITELKPKSVSLIRIFILQQPIFHAFRSELENRFGQLASSHLSLAEKAKLKLKKLQEKYSRTSASPAPKGRTFISSKPQPVVLHVVSCGPDVAKTVKRDLEGILQNELLERVVDAHDFSKLDGMELDAVLGKISVLGVSLEHKGSHISETTDGSRAGDAYRSEARERSGPGQEVYALKGLKEDVLSVNELISKAVQKALYENLQVKEEAMLALDVQWSIQDSQKDWQELSLRDNFMLEQAQLQREVFVEIAAPDGKKVKVNLKAKEATDEQTGAVYRVKRSESETAMILPKHWEPMHAETFMKVELQRGSKEYEDVAGGFHRTAKYNIHKIERVQNYYLWHAYSVCKERILNKNGTQELGEKFLYHGTSEKSCNCIEKDRFDRSFAGTHAAAYGKGVYFAVNANYSADQFSPPDASGLKRLYAARVLTGRYTLGNSAMKAPPLRGSDPADCYDSLVNNVMQPSIFVIFHDDQAYPEYLITFK